MIENVRGTLADGNEEMPIVNVEERQESRERSRAEMRVGKKERKDEIRERTNRRRWK